MNQDSGNQAYVLMANKLREKYRVPGVAAVVIDHDHSNPTEILLGTKKHNSNEPIDSSTLFQVGSLSKTLSAYGIMKLMEQESLDIDKDICAYIKRWKPVNSYPPITIRQLLSHTGGISCHGYPGVHPKRKRYTLEDSISGRGFRRAVKCVEEPGNGARYSGGGYTLLQTLIEDVTGTSFVKYMDTNVLNSFGMTYSTFDYDTALSRSHTDCYGYLGRRKPHYYYAELAACGLYTCLRDIHRFLSWHDTKEGFIQKDVVDQMMKKVRRDVAFGLGFHAAVINRHHVVFNYGINRGWRAGFMMLPQNNKAIGACTNSDRGENWMKEFFTYWLEDNIGPLSPEAKKLLLLDLHGWTYLMLTNAWTVVR